MILFLYVVIHSFIELFEVEDYTMKSVQKFYIFVLTITNMYN